MLAALALTGCMQQTAPSPSARLKLPPPTQKRIEFTNLASRTSATEAAPAITGEELLARAAALQQSSNPAARLQRLVRRFPDAALELLRATTSEQANETMRKAVAVAYDREFVDAGSTGWTRVLIDAGSRPSSFDSIVRARLSALQWIEQGRAAIALGQPAPLGEWAGSAAGAEMRRVKGIAALLCDRPEQAVQLWRSAANWVSGDRNASAEFHLLIATALSAEGRNLDAAQEWATAAVQAARVEDPNLWQRILDARGPNVSWPAAVFTAFHLPGEMQIPAPSEISTEASIWHIVGQWRLSRGELPAALLAFKQAESLWPDLRSQAEARIAEARVLLLMNQSGAAVSILTALTSDTDSQVNHHAMAVLADARIALDDLPGALILLRKAVANDDAFPPALRASARADLGLACLMSSLDQEGLTWLHRAQADFQRVGDDADLVQSLENEAAYFERVGQSATAQALRHRADLISARG